jgi:probable F420-dependent oxidoreductase
MSRPIRFGYQISLEQELDPIAAAQRAEEIGFDTFLVADHVGPGRAPMPMLAAIAVATEKIRLGTLVLNTDMRNPVQLAWEAITVDHLSGGRFELGLGAGHTYQEYPATGIGMDRPAVRKARLAEQVEIIRRLMDGEKVDFAGEHHQITGAAIDQSAGRVPILVGGNGAALLTHAGHHADIIGLQGLGRTHDDGHRHDAKFTPMHLDAQIEHIRSSAGSRVDELEVNALVQAVEITDDADAAMEKLSTLLGGVAVSDLRQVPYVLVGSVDEIVEKIKTCRDRWGITYFVVRELDGFKPVIDSFRAKR